MKENARQGFYNGSPVPLGYMVEEVEKRGARIKKRLVVDSVEAETVKTRTRGATAPAPAASLAPGASTVS
jgi:hypothetical protein